MGREPSFTTEQKQYISNRMAEGASDEVIAAELECRTVQVTGVRPQLPPPDPEYVPGATGEEAEGDTPENTRDTGGDTKSGTTGDTKSDTTGDTKGKGLPITPESVQPTKQKPPKKQQKQQPPPGYVPTRANPNAILDTAEAAGRVINMAGDLAERQSLTAEKIIEIRDDADERAKDRIGRRAEASGAEQGTLIEFIKDDRKYERTRAANDKKAIEEKHAAELAKHQADLDAKLESERSFVETIQTLYANSNQKIEEIREKSLQERQDYLTKKEELIDARAEAKTAEAKAELAKAEELAKTKLDFTEKHIGLLNEHAKTVRDMAKDQGETQLEKLAELAIERIGDPIVRAVTNKEGTGNGSGMALTGAPKKSTTQAEESKGENNVGGLFAGIGKGVFKKIIAKYPDELRKVGDKLAYYIEKWPRLPIGLAVDMLWSWRNDPSIGHYVQTGIAWLMGEELSSLVGLIGASFTDAAKQACSTEEAKKWWNVFQEQIIERYEDEERQAAFFRQEQEAEAAKEKAQEPAAES